MSLPQVAYLTEAEYLAAEQDAAVRHEYVDGHIYAMGGASKSHGRIAGNIFYRLRATPQASACLIVQNDLKVRIREPSVYYYPDVVVACDPDDADPYYTETPCFIAEVLSPGTASIDRREKWLVYRGIPSLRAYLLADSRRRHAEYFLRDAHHAWRRSILEDGERLRVACGGFAFELTLEQIYEQIDFDRRLAEEPAGYASA